MAAGTRLVGRDTELARLGDAVARARDGTHTTVGLEGAAGVGKSRLVTETLARFRDPKDAVAIGYGLELGGGERPYGTALDRLAYVTRLVTDAQLLTVLTLVTGDAPRTGPLTRLNDGQDSGYRPRRRRCTLGTEPPPAGGTS